MAEPLDEDAVPIAPLKSWLDRQGRGARAKLSRDLGVTPQVVTNWLTRRSLPASRLRAVVKLMGTTIDAYLSGGAPTGPRKAEESRLPYAAPMDRKLMESVIRAVDEVLARAQGDRASLIMLAYDYMAAQKTDDLGLLKSFLAQWEKSAAPQRVRDPITWPHVERAGAARETDRPSPTERRVHDDGLPSDRVERRKAQK